MSEADARRDAALSAMGIVRWHRRSVGDDAAPASTPEPSSAAQRTADPGPVVGVVAREQGSVPVALPDDGLTALRATVASCEACVLHETRTQTVFGVGAESARLMIIGEAPGAEEDARGEPFVGRAGALLNAMLEAAGLARDSVYITNILKCRPPRNRDPRPEEMAACGDFLAAQIRHVSPQVLMAVGRIAAQSLLEVSTPIGKLRGREHVHAPTGLPMIVTYHPAYLLRSPGEKRKAWEDLCRLSARLGDAGSEG